MNFRKQVRNLPKTDLVQKREKYHPLKTAEKLDLEDPIVIFIQRRSIIRYILLCTISSRKLISLQ